MPHSEITEATQHKISAAMSKIREAQNALATIPLGEAYTILEATRKVDDAWWALNEGLLATFPGGE